MSGQYPPQQPYSNNYQQYAQQPGFTPSQSLQPGYASPMSPIPQQPMYMPQAPMLPPAKKPRRWPWFLALVVFFFAGMFMGMAIGSSGASSTVPTTTTTTTTTQSQSGGGTSTQPTSAPAAPAKWVTTHTFTGNGTQKTAVFAVGNDWKINWSCNLAASSMGGQYNIIIGVNNSDSTPVDPAAINTLCKTGNTSGSTEEHQGGNVYLDITSEDNWTATIQELK